MQQADLPDQPLGWNRRLLATIIIALLRTQLNGTAIVGLDLILYEGAEEEEKNLAPKRKKMLFHHEIFFNWSINSS